MTPGAHPSRTSNGSLLQSSRARLYATVGAIGFAGDREHAPALDELLETVAVEVFDRHGQPVAAQHRLDHRRAEDAAQPHHAALNLLGPRGWRRLAPQRLGEAVSRNGFAGPKG